MKGSNSFVVCDERQTSAFSLGVSCTGPSEGTLRCLVIFLCDCHPALVLGFSSANKCLLKVAAYAAQLEQYQKAIEIFEQVRLLSAQLRAEGLLEFVC